MSQTIPDIINDFVMYIVKESCEGCTQCNPTLPSRLYPDLACCNEGRAKWLLEKAAEFIEERTVD